MREEGRDRRTEEDVKEGMDRRKKEGKKDD